MSRASPGPRNCRRLRITRLAIGALPAVVAAGCNGDPTGLDWHTVSASGYAIAVTAPDEDLIPILRTWGDRGRTGAQLFLGRGYRRSYVIRVFADRPSLLSYWHLAWHTAGLDDGCAAAREREVTLLSPDAWTAAPCTVGGPAQVERVLGHELVHVLHEQWNGRVAEATAAMPWFVEGLAVAGSGQLRHDYATRVFSMVLAGQQPDSFSAIWRGHLRYGVAGSVAQYLVDLAGSAGLPALIAATDPAAVLAVVKRSEASVMAGWRASVLNPGSGFQGAVAAPPETDPARVPSGGSRARVGGPERTAGRLR